MKYQKLSYTMITCSDWTKNENKCSSPVLRNDQEKQFRAMICSAWLGRYLTLGLLHLWKVHSLLKEGQWPGLKPHGFGTVQFGLISGSVIYYLCVFMGLFIFSDYSLIKLAFQLLIHPKLEIWK